MLPYCDCDSFDMSTTVQAFEFNGCIVVIKNIPCKRCTNCGDVYYDNEVGKKLDKILAQAKTALSQELTLIDFAKVV